MRRGLWTLWACLGELWAFIKIPVQVREVTDSISFKSKNLDKNIMTGMCPLSSLLCMIFSLRSSENFPWIGTEKLKENPIIPTYLVTISTSDWFYLVPVLNSNCESKKLSSWCVTMAFIFRDPIKLQIHSCSRLIVLKLPSGIFL